MKKFLKKQLLRSWNLIKFLWIELIFDFIDDSYEEGDITKFGKYILYLFFGFTMGLWTILMIILMPFILLIFKFDEELGF